jgi:Xaa-Pro aminopeptidase
MRLRLILALLALAASRCVLIASSTLVALCSVIQAQPVITDIFPPEEFAARRARVMEKIGDGISVLQGATERPGEQPLRQNNQFYYLCGVIEPRAILLIDGKTKRTTLFLAAGGERRERMFGSSLFPGEAAAKATGVEAALARDEFAKMIEALAREGRTIYTPFRPEVLGNASASDALGHVRATKDDPWDGRPSREDVFIQKIKSLAPEVNVQNLDPILDAMRAFKSPREIAIIREATRITGLGIMEAMREARPGMFEYELQAPAEFIFKKYGSQGAAYFALIATGRNTLYSHYHKNTARLQDGDLVQFDYAPDYKNYVSDVTRVFPANGKFTAWQREYYTIYLLLYQALMTSIKVHTAPRDIIKDAVVKMDAILASYQFTDPKIKDAATRFVERYRASRSNSLGHTIGMEVHDVRLPTETLEPGQIFTIEPAMTIPDLHLGIRLEDVILITETGYENLSAFVPVEIAEIEKLMAEPGLSERPVKAKAAVPPGSAKVEQRAQGSKPAAKLVASFDGLGVGFEGPQGTANLRNPSDNSLVEPFKSVPPC